MERLQMKRLNNEKGFTLIEAMVVVVILAILAAVGVPQYNAYVDRAKCSEGVVLLNELGLYGVDQMMKDSTVTAATAAATADTDVTDSTSFVTTNALGVFTVTRSGPVGAITSTLSANGLGPVAGTGACTGI